jgi:hypothetical protein
VRRVDDLCVSLERPGLDGRYGLADVDAELGGFTSTST